MIQKFNCIKCIPISYPNSDQLIYIELLNSSEEPVFLLCFNSYIGSLDRLNITEDIINYILDNNMGTYHSYEFLMGVSNMSDWVDIYFNNVSIQLLLEQI